MQLSAKKLRNNRLAHLLGISPQRLGNPGSPPGITKEKKHKGKNNEEEYRFVTFSQCLHFALIFFPDVFFSHLMKSVGSSPKSPMTQNIDSKYYVKYKFASKFI